MKKGFATSAILYTILLLFIVLLVGILNNLQNKKVILDALKEDTINALQNDTVTDAILDQITIINNKLVEMEQKILDINASIPTKVSQLENDAGYITSASNSVYMSSLDEFKSYCVNTIPVGISLWYVNVNGYVYGAIVQKAEKDYLSFILFNYGTNATQYKYNNGTWTIYGL